MNEWNWRRLEAGSHSIYTKHPCPFVARSSTDHGLLMKGHALQARVDILCTLGVIAGASAADWRALSSHNSRSNHDSS
jgi:hypothetical protein